MELAQRRQDESVLVAACTYTGLAHYSDGRFTEAEQMLSEAIERYRPAAHAHHAGELGFDTRVWACSGRALVRWFAGHAGADADAAQAVEWAREIGHVPSLGMALLYQSKGLLARDDRDGVLRTTGELLELAARHGLPAFAGYGGIVRFWAEGDVAQADGTIEALWRMGCRYCQSYYRAYPADTLARQGRWTEALARMDACLQLAYRLDEHMYTAELYLARARCLEGCGAEPGATEAALARAEDAARRAGKFRTLANAGRLRERLLHRQPSDLREGCTT
jgi:tetratricopeptide (TPR) repeat protein